MAQEFTIKSSQIEDKINQLLPSQGGFQPGVDFSASTMVIPIVDLTETAEGGTARADIQSALSLNSITDFSVTNTSSTIINTTGTFRIFGNITLSSQSVASNANGLTITDGTTTKSLFQIQQLGFTGNSNITTIFDFLVLLQAGDSVICTSNNTGVHIRGNTRQIADLAGNLINP